MRPLVLSSPHEPAVADDARVASGTVGAGARGVSPCHSLCHSIGEKRVATGSHGLDESVLFALLTHQLKVTDCNGLDDPDHPLKVAARVRIPYGLPSNPRSEGVFGAVVIALGQPLSITVNESSRHRRSNVPRRVVGETSEQGRQFAPLDVQRVDEAAPPAECGVTADACGLRRGSRATAKSWTSRMEKPTASRSTSAWSKSGR
jgi:hypothetical protein